MPKFLIEASYTVDGTKGLMKEGGSARSAAVEKMITGLGGKMEGFYYAFGKADVYILADLPDSATAAAISLKVNSSGGAQVTTIPLMTVQEMDKAAKMKPAYRAPGV